MWVGNKVHRGIIESELNGVIVTSLHSRAETRVYAKTIVEESQNTRFSDEEQAMLNGALKV